MTARRPVPDRIHMADFPADYFLPEAREGFYVSDMMKRYWAAQIKVLSEIAAICTRHDIPWFAECGTLIGTVRHGGYIPWDDDLDIAMLRHDLRRFIGFAEKELPQGYTILDIAHEEEYGNYLTRITNTRTIDYSDAHLSAFYGCPFTVGIDIFPLDGLYEDEEQEETRRLRAFDVIKASRLCAEGKADTPECKELLSRIASLHHTDVRKDKGLVSRLLLLSERLFSERDSADATHVALMPMWAEYHNHRFDRAWYAHSVEMPFEYTFLPVPAHYDEVLTAIYGDYMRIFKGGGLHDYPVYHDQEEIFREKTGAYPWRFTFEKGKTQPLPAREDGREEKKRQIRETLNTAKEQIRVLTAAGQTDASAQLEAGCAKLEAALEELSSQKKEIVFLPVKASWWDTMRPAWERACGDKGAHITVIVLPYIETGPDGRGTRIVDESADFPAEVTLTKASDYDFGKKHPDRIVIQHPYDGFCNAVSVPEFFHASHLRQFTDCLVYIPCHALYTPAAEDGKARTAMGVLIEQPGCLYADRIILSTETMRTIWIDTLTKLTGEETRKLWEEKAVCEEASADEGNNGYGDKREQTVTSAPPKNGEPEKKTLLWHTTIAFLLAHGDDAIKKYHEVMDTFLPHRDTMRIIWAPHPNMRELETIDPALYASYEKAVRRFTEERIGTFDASFTDDADLSDIDAFYGDASVLAHRLREAGKPVMIGAVV